MNNEYNAEKVRAEIAKNLDKVGINHSSINNDMPALERILSDQSYYNIPAYSRHNPPPKESYLGGYGITRPAIANSLVDNVGQRVRKALSPVQQMLDVGHEPMETLQALAAGAQSVDQSKAFYKSLGLLDKFYNGRDVVENRYSLAADLYAQYLMEQNKNGNSNNGDDGQDKTKEINESSDKGSMYGQIKKFAEWVATLEPYMRILSKYIDKTFGAPTERVKRTKTQDDDGDEIDIIDLDIMQLQRATMDSLATIAIDRRWAAMNLDDMTMEERYTTMTKKFIDVFVIDNSGSMNGERIFKAATYLYNRLEKVERGWAMLALVEFDTSANTILIPSELAGDKPRWLIDTPQKARWAMKHIITRYANMSGGGTNIPAGVMQGLRLSKQMEEHHNGHRPNITVITDDDTSISSLSPEATQGIPINGIAVHQNYPLQNFCISTGGVCYDIEQIELNVGKAAQRI